MKIDIFEECREVDKLLTKAMDIDSDVREMARESISFVNDPDGQWEQNVVDNWGRSSDGVSPNTPKYTFDMTSPIVDQIVAQIANADFDIRISPMGDDQTKDDAQTFDGLIRAIETMSGAKDIYVSAAREIAEGGFSAWKITHDFFDDDSFHQDLKVEPIPDAVDSVFFDPNAKRRDKSDSEYCFVRTDYERDAFEREFPDFKNKGAARSDSYFSTNYWKMKTPEPVSVTQVFYKKYEERDLLLMSDGRVLDDTESNREILDELELVGVTVEDRRKRKKAVIFSRLFSGKEWLTEPQRTAFTMIPVIPVYANYRVVQGKTLFRGIVSKLMDAQRVLNYSQTREIIEGALSPRPKLVATPDQIEGFDNMYRTLNTDHRPFLLYNSDASAPPPFQIGGAQINAGLRVASEGMERILSKAAGLFAANMGDNPGLQSGVAIERLQERGDQGSYEYFKAIKIAVAQTARVLVDAIPIVYDGARSIRLLGEDGTQSNVLINSAMIDRQSGEIRVVNDLSRGKYDVSVNIGKSFENRQEQVSRSIIELGQIDPQFVVKNMDILLSQSSLPAMSQMAERARSDLLKAGTIPVSQLTDEERQQVEMAAQQPQQPEPAQMLAMAEVEKAQADKEAVQVRAQSEMAKMQLESQKMQAEQQIKAVELQMKRLELELREKDAERDDMRALMDVQNNARQVEQNQALASMKQDEHEINMTKKAAETLKITREAMGADAIVGPSVVRSYEQQADILMDQQENILDENSKNEALND